MRAKPVLVVAACSAALLSQTACIVGIGDWARFSKDFHSSYPLKSGGSLSVETFNGSVDISAWDQDTVDVSGTKTAASQQEADDMKVNIDATAGSVSIRVPHSGMRLNNNQGVRFVIKVPRDTLLDRITTSNSSIRTQDGRGTARLKTSNGSIYVADLRGDLEAETSNSSIEVQGVDGNVRLHTSNGRIRAERLNGSLDAGTSNSGVNVELTRADKPVRIDTSNSGVELSLPPHFASPVRIHTNNGPITLRMGDGTNADITARTSNSSIKTEFDVRARGDLSKSRLEGVIGSGGPLIDLSTSNGSIHLLRR